MGPRPKLCSFGIIAALLLSAACAQGELRDRTLAIERGLQFIYASASNQRNFTKYGADYLWCLYSIASTSKDANLAATARRMAEERATVWRSANVSLPAHPTPNDVEELVFGAYVLERLGHPDGALKEIARRAAANFSARDFLLFDPAIAPPPSDIPLGCAHCGSRNRYDVWDDALISTYTGDCYGVTLGAHYRDVLRWVGAMRPYANPRGRSVAEFYNTVYAITHLIYTLNDYSSYRLKPEWLPAEFAYLRKNLTQAIKLHDPETMGEFLDTLRSFGMEETDPLMRKGLNFLMKTQNADGSWGNLKDPDVYNRYHSTWTAVDGLRDYQWRGERLSYPELQPLLR